MLTFIFSTFLVFLLVLGFSIFSFSASTIHWPEVDVPPTTPSGATIGPRKIYGYAQPVEPHSVPMLSPISKTPCIWFEITIDEVVEPFIRYKSSEYIAIADQYDSVLVQMSFCDVNLTKPIDNATDERTMQIAEQYLSKLTGDKVWPDSFEVTERVVAANEVLYASCLATYSPNSGDIILREANELVDSSEKDWPIDQELSNDPQSFSGHISKSRKFFVHGGLRLYARLFAMCSSTFLSFVLIFPSEELFVEIGMRVLAIAFIYLLFNLPLTILRNVATYNRFVRLRNSIEQNRGSLSALYSRRAALIPKLVNVLEELVKHESYVNERLIEIRTKTNESYGHVVAIAEKYPQLNSSDSFLQLQKELGRTETRIANTKQYVNDIILRMDNFRSTMRGMFFSPLFKREPYIG